uniref:Uncharacterized protein n=1 Tax=Fagus sylvatica TaxID=28930 RepID=A0A2N9H729_FAGSY
MASLPLSSHASLSSSMAEALKLATSQGRHTTTHGGRCLWIWPWVMPWVVAVWPWVVDCGLWR